MRYEVGVAHRDAVGRLWLVLSLEPLVLAGGRMGRVATHQPREAPRLEPARGVTVEDLCQRWKVDVEAIDAAAAPFLAPRPAAVKPRARRGRPTRADVEASVVEVRTHRHAYA